MYFYLYHESKSGLVLFFALFKDTLKWGKHHYTLFSSKKAMIEKYIF